MPTRSRSRVPARLVRCVTLVLTCLLLPQAHAAAFGRTQEAAREEQPITKDKLMRSLRAGVQDPKSKIAAARFIELIRKYGVRFIVTPADERNIRREGVYLGASVLNKLIAALRSSYRPATSMSGRIEQVKVTGNPGGGVQVFVQLTVANEGPPSVARKYNLRIMHVTSARIDFNNTATDFGGPYTVNEPGTAGETVIKPEDSLALKTSQAIRTGASVTGWLRFFLPPLPQTEPEDQLKPEALREPGLWYVVSFVDVAGEVYETVFKMN